jgi:hypothetical protein
MDDGHAYATAAGAGRPLHRDRPGREGSDAELVTRLASGLGPEPARRALVRCLDGELSARATLAQLLLVTRSATAVRELVDEVTARTDADSRAGDALVRARADALTRLVIETGPACASALARDAGGAVPAPAPGEGAYDEGAYYERVLDAMLAA